MTPPSIVYYLAGMRVRHWRRLAVETMLLQPGDTVIDLGCGTGLNFSLLEQRIGDNGKIFGLGIPEAMLDRARKRVNRAGWHNVELVCCASADYQFPDRGDGIVAIGVLNYEPEFDKVIGQGAKALAPGHRWVVLDYELPDNWFRYLALLFVTLGRAFGVSCALMERRVWESMHHHLGNTRMRELYGGFVRLILGEASSSRNRGVASEASSASLADAAGSGAISHGLCAKVDA